MRIRHRAQMLVRLAGTAALSLTAIMVASPPATADSAGAARMTFPGLSPKSAAGWGYNGSGELGDGTTHTRALFAQITGLGSGVVQVDAGTYHALAVRSDGSVWAWGFNSIGELGDGTVTSRPAPVRVIGLTGTFIAVSAGDTHSLALRSDGTVWAWGDNRSGELGNGVTSLEQLTPVQVTGLTGVTKISAGTGFSLALRSDGTVWAWGDNYGNKLGTGQRIPYSAVPVQVANLSQITSISAGDTTSLALRTSSTGVTTAWVWGDNDRGGLGDGTTDPRSIPAQVTGIVAPGIAGVAAGVDFALVLGTDGSVWGWGYGYFNELAIGRQTTLILRPMQVIKPVSGIVQIAAGSREALALKSNGTVLSWGDNELGGLGDGTTTGYGPTQVLGLTNVSQVSCGNQFGLAVYLPPPVSTQ